MKNLIVFINFAIFNVSLLAMESSDNCKELAQPNQLTSRTDSDLDNNNPSSEKEKMEIDSFSNPVTSKRKIEEIEQNESSDNAENPNKKARYEIKDLEIANLADEESKNSFIIEKQQSPFDVLPIELVVYILSFLFDAPLLKSDKPIDRLANILLDQNLANALLVNRQWNDLIKESLGKVIKKNILDLYPKNKECFESKFFEICQKNTISKIDIEIFKCLLNAGIDLNLKNELESTALTLVVNGNLIELVKLILNHVRNLDQEAQMKVIDVHDEETGYTPLIMASYDGHIEIIMLIIDHIKTLDLDKQLVIICANNESNNNALIWAVRDDGGNHKGEHDKIAKFILDYIKIFDEITQKNIINTKCGDSGDTILLAAADGNKKIVKLILKKISSFEEDAQIEILGAQDDNGQTALMIAAKREYYLDISYEGILALLFKYISRFSHDAQLKIINSKDSRGNTVLIAAVDNGNKETAELIVHYMRKFDINVQMYIINAKNNDNHSALTLAKINGYKEIVNLLDNVCTQ